VTSLEGHTGRVLCVKVRGDLTATGSSDSTIRIWSLESGRCVQVLTGHSKGVQCLHFYGKRLLISGSSDQTVKVWNIVTGACESTAAEVHTGTVWCLQQKKEVLITGSHDKSAVIWSARSLQARLSLEGHGGVVLAAELSDSATTAFTGAGDGLVRVWRVECGECVRTVGVMGAPPITSLSWSKGWLAWSSGTTVSVWDSLHWRKRCELTGHEDRVECVQLKVHEERSGRGLVLTSSRDSTVRYWTSGSGRQISSLRGHTATVNSVSSCSWAIVSGSDDRSLRLWNFHAYHPS
jgi:WD40 repeat protein